MRLSPARPSFRPRWPALAFVVVVALAGCSGDDDDAAEVDTTDPAAAAAADLATSDTAPADGDASDDENEPEPLAATDVPGEPLHPSLLGVDDCFEQLEDVRDGQTQTITTRVGCDEEHHFQVFAQLQYPAPYPSPYPGDDVMIDYALRACYVEFPNWAGIDFERSVLDIGVFTPELENFEDSAARYRGIHCWVRHIDGEPLDGPMRGAGV